MIQLARDARHAFRNLARRPGFTLTAILILGVGIGSATTIFSVVDRVLLRELPYPGAERLMVFTQGAHSGPDWVEWTESLGSFEALGAAWDGAFDAGALALSPVAESLVWGITPRDPATLTTAITVLAASALAACLAPARRATRVDPVEALRAD